MGLNLLFHVFRQRNEIFLNRPAQTLSHFQSNQNHLGLNVRELLGI